jgi:MFS superfamily sulfate permease-like transporter
LLILGTAHTAATVVVVEVEAALFLAIVLSLLEHVRYGYQPKNTVLALEVVDGEQGWRSFPVPTTVEARPGLLIYCFNHSLYYANTEKFSEEILALRRCGGD